MAATGVLIGCALLASVPAELATGPVPMCYCAASPDTAVAVHEALDFADAVFSARVQEIDTPEQAEIDACMESLGSRPGRDASDEAQGAWYTRSRDCSQRRVTFRVLDAWKGVLQPTATASTHIQSPTCGYRFEEGRRYLVYAWLSGSGELSVSSCSRTRRLGRAEFDLGVLGRPTWRRGESR
jgi:hypothetical protein